MPPSLACCHSASLLRAGRGDGNAPAGSAVRGGGGGTVISSPALG